MLTAFLVPALSWHLQVHAELCHRSTHAGCLSTSRPPTPEWRRMRPEISAWPGATFYGGALQDAPKTRAPGYGTSSVRLPQGLPNYAFIGTSAASSSASSRGGGSTHSRSRSLYCERQGGGGGSSSWSNPGEAELVVQLLLLLERSCQAGTSVGLISPYSAQVSQQVRAGASS